MLQSLQIQSVALIEKLDITFNDGFHVLTGETGAGKSIIIDAVNFVLGERANKDLIQTGADKASVQASFLIDKTPLIIDKLIELDIPYEKGDQLIISRTLTTSGKNTIRINGVIVNLSTLKEITDLLVDVHGQHEHQSLLHPENHCAFLDYFGSAEIEPLKQTLSRLYQRSSYIQKELMSGFLSEEDRARKIDVLEYQIKEITAAQLKENEEEELFIQLGILSNAQQIKTALELSYDNLTKEQGALDTLNFACNQIEGIASFHESYQELQNKISEVYYSIQDISYTLRDFKTDNEFSPQALQDCENRIDLIQTLKRKYGGTISDVIKFLDDAQTELETLTKSEGKRSELRQELESINEEYQKIAAALTNVRKEIAKKLENSIQLQLNDLGLENSTFSVSIDTLSSPSSNGLDKIEFLLSTNAGEPLKPLHKIASGGELSRIMLAFKTICFGLIPTIIFDEIDTGISGHTATIVGQKMLQIALYHQVLCVTHLPQIASMADTHYNVQKNEKDGRTTSSLTELSEKERIIELARIMGAIDEDVQAYKHAWELLKRAKDFKASQLSLKNN